MAKSKNGFGALLMTLVASVMLILIGLFYFLVTLWIVKIGANLLDYTLDGNWAVLAASLLSVGSMIGSAIQKM